MNETVFLNGKFLPLCEAKVSVLEPGFLYGLGLFETMRAYKRNIVYFDAHLRRIKEACALAGMDFPYAQKEAKDLVRKTIHANRFDDAYVRLTVYKTQEGAGVLIIVKQYKPYPLSEYRKGMSVCLSPLKQNEGSFLYSLKSTNYLFYRLAYANAQERGFDDSIILNNRGYLCETSRANIFFIKDGRLWTPQLTCGCLGGITRKVVFDLAKKHRIKIYQGCFTAQDLLDSDGAFITNSLLGIMPLASLENKLIAKGRVCELSDFFIKKYRLLLTNGT